MPNWTSFGRFDDFPAVGDSVNRLASDAPLSAGLAGSFPLCMGIQGGAKTYRISRPAMLLNHMMQQQLSCRGCHPAQAGC